MAVFKLKNRIKNPLSLKILACSLKILACSIGARNLGAL
jgi:hypothetical protein